MTAATQKYLEQSRIDEIADHHEALGYDVERNPNGDDASFDLLAKKEGKTIAFVVRAQGTLRKSDELLRRARETAHRKGYEFRLAVAVPPLQRVILIAGFKDKLGDYLSDDTPSELLNLTGQVDVDDVRDVEIESLSATEAEIHVDGNATVEVTLHQGGGTEKDGMSWHDAFPFRFSVTLAPDLSIRSVESLEVDTASFYD